MVFHHSIARRDPTRLSRRSMLPSLGVPDCRSLSYMVIKARQSPDSEATCCHSLYKHIFRLESAFPREKTSLKGHCPDCAHVFHTHAKLEKIAVFSSFSLTSNRIEIASTLEHTIV